MGGGGQGEVDNEGRSQHYEYNDFELDVTCYFP